MIAAFVVAVVVLLVVNRPYAITMRGTFNSAAPMKWSISVVVSGTMVGKTARSTHPSLNKRGNSFRDSTTIIAPDDTTIPGTEANVKIFWLIKYANTGSTTVNDTFQHPMSDGSRMKKGVPKTLSLITKELIWNNLYSNESFTLIMECDKVETMP